MKEPEVEDEKRGFGSSIMKLYKGANKSSKTASPDVTKKQTQASFAMPTVVPTGNSLIQNVSNKHAVEIQRSAALPQGIMSSKKPDKIEHLSIRMVPSV